MTLTKERLARLSLGCFPGFGSRSLRRLWRVLKNPESAWLASRAKIEQAGITAKIAEHFVEWRSRFDLQNTLDLLTKQKIAVLFPDDAAYPRLFRESSDPPEILFVRGTLKDVPLVSVVGTRRITNYGSRAIDLLLPPLVQSGFGIVSGLALGIDGATHRATLHAEGYTIAILGTGIDDDAIYPREHLVLAQHILEHGGAILSELPPGSPGRKEHFPLRNRLIASISSATLVVEATGDSGSLITAKLALEENREVLAVPGPIWSATSAGTNHLIKIGAKLCTKAEDVLEALAFDRPELMAQARATLPLNSQEELVLSLLESPRHIDELGRELLLPSGTIASCLALLELKGLIKPIGGQMWAK